MFNGGPDLFEVLRRNSEEKKKKGTRKGILSWFGVQKAEQAPTPRPEGLSLLDRIEQGGERIFASLPDDSSSPSSPPAPEAAPAIPAAAAPAKEIEAAVSAALEPAATATAVAEQPLAKPSPARGRAKEIQFTLRAQNLVILCLVFTAMFMLSFVMGYQAGQSPADPLANEPADASGMAALSFDHIPPVEMGGRGRPPAILPETTENPAPEEASAPVPSEAGPVATLGKYTLQIATFTPRDRTRAEALAGKLKASGLDSAVYTVKGTRSDHVVVCAGTFASRNSSEARTFERKVKDLREGGRALVSSATLWRSIPQQEVPGVHR